MTVTSIDKGLYVASYFSKRLKTNVIKYDDWWFIVFVSCIAVVLLLLQPDFGSAVVLMSMVMGLMILSGLPMSWLTVAVVFGGGVCVLLVWLEPYRFSRVITLQRVNLFLET